MDLSNKLIVLSKLLFGEKCLNNDFYVFFKDSN